MWEGVVLSRIFHFKEIRSLFRYQVESIDSQGIPFMMLYSLARAQFLVVSDTALRAQLIEFRDHKLIKSKKGSDGGEYLASPLENYILENLIAMEDATKKA